jgi:ribose transport system substrate-binding protein
MSLRVSLNARTAALAALLLAAACSGDAGAGAPSGSRTLRLAVIPKGTTHVFWRAVEEGARAGAAAQGVEIDWKGPLQESDRVQQIQLVQQFAAAGVDGIAIAPLDHQALAAPLAEARARGIEVVVFDSALDGTPGEDFASFVATDNLAGGRMAGAELARLLGGRGAVVLLRYQVGSASTEAREQGFLEAARAGGLAIAVENRYAGATAGEAKNEALNLEHELRQADGVFCSNESATNGMLLALRQAGLADRLAFVGFDASPPLVEALQRGEIDALVVQDPRKMGRLAVETLAAAVRGESVPRSIDTGAVLATRANMESPEIAPLLR